MSDWLIFIAAQVACVAVGSIGGIAIAYGVIKLQQWWINR